MTYQLEYEIQLDEEYTKELRDKVRVRFGSNKPRPATHVSDLLMCLRKSWAKKNVEGCEEGEISDDTLLTWLGGLLFEDVVSVGGEVQPATALCWECRTLTFVGEVREEPYCPTCGSRWLVGTPDYILDGIIHEVKQTRKSRRAGPENAPWWAEQVAAYLLFYRLTGDASPNWAREVVNWLMGDYGSKRKGEQPRPPQSALDAFRITFKERWEEGWEGELRRRQAIVEGEEMPALTGIEGNDNRVPAYSWECSSCEVGLKIDCPMFLWNEEGKVKEVEDVAMQEEG